MSEDLSKMIAKLEMHKGGAYTLNQRELRAVLAWIKDYVSLMRKLEGDYGKDEREGTY